MNGPELQGITASVPQLLRLRPPRERSGFAPGGRVSTHQWGSNASIFHGRGMEFAEARTYQPGDDVRSIDWRVTARTGCAHTKLFQEERERPVHLLVDLRSMMHFGSRVCFKSNLAARVAAMLAWVAHDGGDRLGGLILTRRGVVDVRAARTRRSLLRFIETLADETLPDTQPDTETSLSAGLRRLHRVCRPGTLAFVISDFSDFDTPTAQQLKRLSHSAHVTAVHVNDPFDAMLPRTGARVSDGSGAVALSSLGKNALNDYAEDYQQRCTQLDKLCRQSGIVLHRLSTAEEPQRILYPPKPRRQAA